MIEHALRADDRAQLVDEICLTSRGRHRAPPRRMGDPYLQATIIVAVADYRRCEFAAPEAHMSPMKRSSPKKMRATCPGRWV